MELKWYAQNCWLRVHFIHLTKRINPGHDILHTQYSRAYYTNMRWVFAIYAPKLWAYRKQTTFTLFRRGSKPQQSFLRKLNCVVFRLVIQICLEIQPARTCAWVGCLPNIMLSVYRILT